MAVNVGSPADNNQAVDHRLIARTPRVPARHFAPFVRAAIADLQGPRRDLRAQHLPVEQQLSAGMSGKVRTKVLTRTTLRRRMITPHEERKGAVS